MLIFKRTDSETPIHCPETWEEITLGRYIKFQQLYSETMDELKKEFSVKDESELVMSDVLLQCPQYFKKIVGFWLKLNAFDIDRAEYSNIITVWGILSNVLQPPSDISSSPEFTFNDKTYKIRKPETDYSYVPIEFSGYTFGEVIEFLQIETNQRELTTGKLSSLPLQIALMYKEEGEGNDTELVKEKAKSFDSLTMDVVWGLSFFLIRKKLNWQRAILSSSQKAARKNVPAD